MLRLWQPDKRLQIQCENFPSLCGWREPFSSWERTSICCPLYDCATPLNLCLGDIIFVLNWTTSFLLVHSFEVVSFYPMAGKGCVFSDNRLLGLVRSQQSMVCKPSPVFGLWSQGVFIQLLHGSSPAGNGALTNTQLLLLDAKEMAFFSLLQPVPNLLQTEPESGMEGYP